jgi:ADP-heptose:LPS heptosyltransferase
MKRKIKKSRVNRILVITLSNVGDVILTTPVTEALINEFPEAKLDVMVGPNGKNVFQGYGKIRDVIVYDKKSSPREKFGLFIYLLKRKYDLVVDLRNTLFPFILGARYRTNPFRHRERVISHKTEEHLSLLRDLGISTEGAPFYIHITESDEKAAQGLLRPIKGKPFCVMSPGAKSHVKRWPLKNYARLADKIKKELGLEVVLVGDQYDRIVIERILHLMKTRPLNLIEKTSIPELAYIIKRARFLVTNDSAPLHIGGSVNSKILAFFGPTDHAKYGPLTKEKSVLLRKDLKCSPCKVPQCINTGSKYECLKTITVDQAFSSLKQLGDVSLRRNPL